jgi:Mg-chelatase subunit ChlD
MLPKTLLIALLFVTSLNPTDLPAQDTGCTTRTVPVGVVDREWNFVQGLSAANFRGKLRGHDVEILSASIDTSPRRIVLLLDASGSMAMSKEAWHASRSLSEDLIRFAPPRASIAQMAFSETIKDSAGFDQDRLALLKRQAVMFEHLRGGGRTALYDAISSARGAFGMLDFGDVIYAVTDAGDNKSRTHPEGLEEDLLTAGVRLFAAVTAHDLPTRSRTPEETEGPYRLRSMAEATGGNVLIVPYGPPIPLAYIKAKGMGDRINLALQRLYQQMGEFYRLDVRLPETVDKPAKWKLEVLDADGKPNRRVEVHYPQQLMPCAKAGP